MSEKGFSYIYTPRPDAMHRTQGEEEEGGKKYIQFIPIHFIHIATDSNHETLIWRIFSPFVPTPLLAPPAFVVPSLLLPVDGRSLAAASLPFPGPDSSEGGDGEGR